MITEVEGDVRVPFFILRIFGLTYRIIIATNPVWNYQIAVVLFTLIS